MFEYEEPFHRMHLPFMKETIIITLGIIRFFLTFNAAMKLN